jgi:surfactin synthase thioesterase subunit
MRAMLLPTLRADVELHEQYVPTFHEPLPVPIMAVRGVADELVSTEELLEWQRATTKPLTLVELEGGHMYLAESPAQLLQAIAAVGNKVTQRDSNATLS